MKNTEAIVVGGGPAGTASALAIRRLGRDVTLLESMTDTSPIGWKKVCGSFLNVEAVSALSGLGMLKSVIQSGGRPVTHLLITEPSGHAARVSLASSRGGPLCVRRSVLDGLLLEEAARCGVRVQMGAEVRGVEGRTVSCREGRIEAGIIVLADGKQCRWGSPEGRRMKQASGAEGWFGWSADFSDSHGSSSQIELHLFKEGYIGLINFEPGVTHLCGLSRQRLIKQAGGDFDALIERASSGHARLKERLREMARQTSWKAVGPLPFGRMSPLSSDHFLVGDAAAVIDPFVGGGIGMALESGRLLEPALEGSPRTEEALQSYRRLWNRRFRGRLAASRFFRVCLGEEWRLRSIVSLMERWPSSLSILTRYFGAGGLGQNFSIPVASRS